MKLNWNYGVCENGVYENGPCQLVWTEMVRTKFIVWTEIAQNEEWRKKSTV